jgi:4-diphosphocytidyl-2-C-methyl-D-erythritol kinase
VAVTLDKQVPLGAGLGGGSSDAAAVLWALDTLAGTKLSLEVLSTMAAQLGSDVPFFMLFHVSHYKAVFVSGRGEHLLGIEKSAGLSAFSIVLVYPGFVSNTAQAFQMFDRAQEHSVISSASPDGEVLMRALEDNPSTWPFVNDFLPVFLQGEYADRYRTILEEFRKQGADFCGLSGAGSSCFGLFKDKIAAERARRVFSRFSYQNFVRITEVASCTFENAVLK